MARKATKKAAARPRKAAGSRAAKPRIVEAVAVAVNRAEIGEEGRARADRIQRAMSDAVKTALDQGITDPAKQREMMIAARDKAVAAEG